MQLKIMIIAIALLSLGCAPAKAPNPNQTIKDVGTNVTTPEDFQRTTVQALNKLSATPAKDREKIFTDLSNNDDSTLCLVVADGKTFFSALKAVEGYRGKDAPTKKRLEQLFEDWNKAKGDTGSKLIALYRVWSVPVTDVLVKWYADLPTRTEKGRRYEGWQLINKGNQPWPIGLGVSPVEQSLNEVFDKNPVKLFAGLMPGKMQNVEIDVTDVKMKGDIFFQTTCLDERGKRRFVKARPETLLGMKPQKALFITLK